jgi:hypothetical protein
LSAIVFTAIEDAFSGPEFSEYDQDRSNKFATLKPWAVGRNSTSGCFNRIAVGCRQGRYRHPSEVGMSIRLSIWGFAQLFAFGGAVIFVLVASSYRAVKHSLYYSKADAIVQWAGMGCSVRGLSETARAAIANNPRLANEAWLDCREVKTAVASFKKEEVKVSWRQQAYVRFVSPADGRERFTLVALTMDQSKTMPASGATLPIYAHKKDPSVVDPYY